MRRSKEMTTAGPSWVQRTMMRRRSHSRGATLAEIEHVYRTRLVQFRRVATAITGDPERGADAVQEAFGGAIRNRSDFRGAGPLDAWLWRAVVNRARDIARRRVDGPLEQPAPASQNGSPDQDAAVRALVAALPERQRLALFLRYYADLDYEGIAQALGMKPGTVAATLSAARGSLRGLLEEVPR
jgi:RNA polymerase sigma-70 factor, ECF subfamily